MMKSARGCKFCHKVVVAHSCVAPVCNARVPRGSGTCPPEAGGTDRAHETWALQIGHIISSQHKNEPLLPPTLNTGFLISDGSHLKFRDDVLRQNQDPFPIVAIQQESPRPNCRELSCSGRSRLQVDTIEMQFYNLLRLRLSTPQNMQPYKGYSGLPRVSKIVPSTPNQGEIFLHEEEFCPL